MNKTKIEDHAMRWIHYLPIIALFPFFILACNAKRPSAKVNDISQDTIIPHPDINKTVSLAKIGVAKVDRFGQYLTDAQGRTLYMFTGDNQYKSSACYVNCSEVWPPFLTTDEPVASAPAIQESLLGTIERKDGSLQVTYNGWPLYYYKEDKGPGFLTGQDVNGFGGDWYIIAPDGSPIAPESSKNPKSRQ